MQSTWRSARAQLIGSGSATALMLVAGMAAPSMAQAGFSEDLGIIKACGSDVWSLCSDVLPDVGKRSGMTSDTHVECAEFSSGSRPHP